MCDLLDCKDCRFLCKDDVTDIQVEQLWEQLEDIPFDEIENGTLILSEDWQGWVKGTQREEIWKWFDEHHSKGVIYLLYGTTEDVDSKYYTKRYNEIAEQIDKIDGINKNFALWYLLKEYLREELHITDKEVREADTVEKYRELVMKRDIAVQVEKLVDILSFGL